MKQFFLVLAIILTLLFGCKSPEYVSTFKVTNLKQVDSISFNHLIYCLPKTTLRFQFEVTSIKEIPGPYVDYAETLLALENIIESKNEKFYISNVSMKDYNEPDQDHFYVIEYDTANFQHFISLSNKGYLLNMGDSDFGNELQTSMDPIVNLEKPEEINFGPTDLFLKKNIVTKSTKKYRTIRTDSTTVRIPINSSYKEAKSTKENAEEAANFIIKLRKRKFKLMAGLYENAPDDIAVPEMIKELEELEKSYIELFTGRVETRTYNYSFDYTPDPNNAIKSFTLCYFSNIKGLLTLNDLSSSPNLEKGMNIKPVNVNIDANLSIYKNINLSQNLENEGIYYRIPVYTGINVYKGNDIIYTQKTQINQFGRNVVLSKKYLSTDYNIDFYPESGGLKTIRKK